MNKVFTIHPQLQQVINLALLLMVGKISEHMYLSWGNILFLLLVAFLTETILVYLRDPASVYIPFSALSTSMGIMLMLVTPHLWIMAILIIFALLQKHFLVWGERHFFNPSNFALIMGMLFFYQDTHIVLGQLGDSIWFGIFVVILGLPMLYRVNRLIIPFVFSVSYIWIQYALIMWSDPVLIMEEVFYRFYSISFMVFVFFMITDPKTTPEKYWMQSLFAILIAFSATLLDYYYGFRVQHLFMVLFVASALVPIAVSWKECRYKKESILLNFVILFLALSAIIYIQMQPPYYFEMDG